MYWNDCVHPQNLNHEMLEDHLSTKIEPLENFPLYSIPVIMRSQRCLCNAPAIFQHLMETVLAGLVCTYCVMYLDDILVIGRTVKEHLDNLEKVFERLWEAGLRLKPKKCYFLRKEVEYLGHMVSADGVRPDLQKLSAVCNYAQPTDLKSLWVFLGLASHYSSSFFLCG